jgi:hypothetical protein
MFFAWQRTWRDLTKSLLAFGGSAYFIEGKKYGEISPTAESGEAEPPESRQKRDYSWLVTHS